MKKPRRGWGRWKRRAGKRREWIASEINRVTKKWLDAGAGNRLVKNIFGKGGVNAKTAS
jgi:hypothetical protein